MNRSTIIILISLAASAIFITGPAGAQAAGENVSMAGLSGADNGTSDVERLDLSNMSTLRGGVTDVTRIADVEEIFAVNRSVNVNIDGVFASGSDVWMMISNDGLVPINMTGWTLALNNATIYAFPAFDFEDGASIRVHAGGGASTPSDLYTGGQLPADGFLTLYNPLGDIVSTYTYPVVSEVLPQPIAVDPLERYSGQIQL